MEAGRRREKQEEEEEEEEEQQKQEKHEQDGRRVGRASERAERCTLVGIQEVGLR